MADRDGPTVDVHPLVVEPELSHHREALRCECLVQLDEIDLRDIDARAGEQLAHGRNRSDPHHARIDAGDSAADERAERLDAELARLLVRRDHERSCAIVQPGRVTGGDGAVLAERRRERCELLERRVGAGVLVAAQFADGDELVVEATRICSGGPAPV